MTNIVDPLGDSADDLPEAWSDPARETYLAVLGEYPDLTSAQQAALWQAASLESAADHLDAVAQAAGYVSEGSMGQVVIHPAVPEARQARATAGQILQRLAASARSQMTPSDRARRAARARWSR